MNHLTIYRLYLTNSGCYQSGTTQKPRGVQVHSTGANNPYLKRYVQPDDGRLGVNTNGNSHNKPGGSVCASAYIGKLQDGTVAVYQTLPWEYRCWLSGSGGNGNANKLGYIGFEICEDNTENESYFNEAVKNASVLLTAHLCQMMGVTPWEIIRQTKDGPAYAVMDHAALHDVGLASNHGDIGLWMRHFGYTFSDYRDLVQAAMDEGVDVTYIDAKGDEPMGRPTLRRGDSGEDVKYLQTLLVKAGYGAFLGDNPIDGRFGALTEEAVKAFQDDCYLTMDGIVGPMTWKDLEETVASMDYTEPTDGLVIPADCIVMKKEDFAALKAAYTTLSGIIRKYE